MHGRDRSHQCGVKGSRLHGISYSWEVSRVKPAGQRRTQSPGKRRKGGGGRRPAGSAGDAAKRPGLEHKASQIDLSLHEEGRADALNYHKSPVAFKMTEFLQLSSFQQQPISIINKSLMCQLFDFRFKWRTVAPFKWRALYASNPTTLNSLTSAQITIRHLVLCAAN